MSIPNRRVLYLIEDDARIRDALIPMIEQLTDFEVAAFSEAEDEAVDWLAAHPGQTDVVILDVFRKQGTGIGVLTRQQEFPPACRIVVLTNTATLEIRSQCLRLGAQAVFDKTAELESFFDFCGTLQKAA